MNVLSMRRLAVVAATALAFPVFTQAGLQIPYATDSSTLHLWHLDETSGTSGADAVTANSITLTNLGIPTGGPFTNTTFGATAFSGLGTAVSASTKQHVLYGGAFPDVTQFSDPETGAFTFEALVKFDTDPLGANDAEIVSGDNGLGLGNRGWQWRIFNGVMEWDLLAGDTDNDFKAPLPATGPNAAIAGAWYHAAVTFSGYNPTDGSQPYVIKFYWTLLDENRTEADLLGQFDATRTLDGSPSGTAQPSLGVGGSARNIAANPGNNEGLVGSIDEVRISSVARGPSEMAFKTGGASNPPSFTTQPATNVLVNYGADLTLAALVSGTPPLHFEWHQDGTIVAGQDTGTLVIPGATFAQNGSYQLIVTNNFGSATSTVAVVTVGAGGSGLANTGYDSTGALSTGDVPDAHWTLLRSSDPLYLGPDAFVYEYSFPIQFADPNGGFSPTNGVSMWIGASGNPGGAPATSPAGNYIYRMRFLLDSADPGTFKISGNLWVSGSVSDILVNGQSSGVSVAPGGTLYVGTFAITNGFVAGWNTLDFVENLAGAGISAIRVELRGSGQAIAAGKPVIIDEPADETVRDTAAGASKAVFSVAAIGRSPLTYQWLADGTPLPGATNRVLTLQGPTAGGQAENYSVEVSNDSGTVTSRAAKLNIAPGNQLPEAATFNLVSFEGQQLTLPLSDITQASTDPDHDAILFSFADGASANGAVVELLNADIVYHPVEGFTGSDQFTYTISDNFDFQSVAGTVNVLALSSPSNQVVAPGGTATFGAGITEVPAGYTFQWQLNGTNVDGATGSQLTISNAQLENAGSYQLVVTDSSGKSWTSPAAGLVVGTLGSGSGLIGDYYSDQVAGSTNFTDPPTLSRIDPTIDFNWGTDAPDPSISVDGFSVRWHGQVQPIYSDLYTFATTTDDGARLWVNDQLVIDHWVNQAATTTTGTIQLQAGQKYNIVMEYYDNTSSASARLSWSSAHQGLEVIPSTQLYPVDAVSAPTLTLERSENQLILNWSGTFTLQSSTNLSNGWSTVAPGASGPYPVTIGGEPSVFYRLVTPN
jgi:hypothetical protein